MSALKKILVFVITCVLGCAGLLVASPAQAANLAVTGTVTVAGERFSVASKLTDAAVSAAPHGYVVSVQPAAKLNAGASVAAKHVAFTNPNATELATTVKVKASKLKRGADYKLAVYQANQQGFAPADAQPLVTAPLVITPAQWDAARGFATGSGYLQWGLRSAFINYLTKGIAQGKDTVLAPAMRAQLGYEFPQVGKSTFDAATGFGKVEYTGAVRFYGHHGALDFSIYNPQIEIVSDTQAYLSVPVDGVITKLVEINLGDATKSVGANNEVIYANAPTKLHADGVDLFSYGASKFYPVGEGFDPITFAVGANSGANLLAVPAKTNNNGGGIVAGNIPGVADPNANAAANEAVKNPEAGTLRWGISTSFARYVAEGYVVGRTTPVNTKGRVQGYGTAGGLGGFIFPQISTGFNFATGTGTVQYNGAVHFYAHGGLLDLTFANPSITVVDNSRAEMYANGKHWGSLDLSTAAKSMSPNGAITWTGATFIPGGGAKAFLRNDFDSSGKIGFDQSVTFTVGSNAANFKTTGSSFGKQGAAKPKETTAESKETASDLKASFGLKKHNDAKFAKKATGKSLKQAANPATNDILQSVVFWWVGAGVLCLLAATLVVLATQKIRK